MSRVDPDCPDCVDLALAIDRPDTEVGNTWALTDHQGTVRDLVGHYLDGTLCHEDIEYTPFGVPTDLSGLAGGVSTFYAGRDLDSFTGLYNNRARWYDAAAGRFISEDPVDADMNPYRYAANSPANATDPTGLEAAWWAGTKALVSTFSGNLWHGVSSLFTGEAGRALGERVVAISERHGDGQFNGDIGDWGNFAYYTTVEILGISGIHQGLSGEDLATGRALNGWDRWTRGAAGVGQLAGWAAGGLTVGARIAPGTLGWATKAPLPGSALVSRVTTPVANVTSRAAGAAARAVPTPLRNAAHATARLLKTDVRDLARRAFSRQNARSSPPGARGVPVHEDVVASYEAKGATNLGFHHKTTDVALGGPGSPQISVVTADLNSPTYNVLVKPGNVARLTSTVKAKAWKFATDPKAGPLPRTVHLETYGRTPTQAHVEAIAAAQKEAASFSTPIDIIWSHRP